MWSNSNNSNTIQNKLIETTHFNNIYNLFTNVVWGPLEVSVIGQFHFSLNDIDFCDCQFIIICL